jgi:hypothetical protein
MPGSAARISPLKTAIMKDIKKNSAHQEQAIRERQHQHARPDYRTNSTHLPLQGKALNGDEPKLNRRYSFDDNGGGYARL